MYPNQLHLVFNVVEYNLPHFNPTTATTQPTNINHNTTDSNNNAPTNSIPLRFGVCTRWLEQLVQPSLLSPATHNNNNNNLSLRIPVFKRPSSNNITNEFQLPTDISIPLIMIGPGAGVAPFRAFLQHRAQQQQQLRSHTENSNGNSNTTRGEHWLFYGCRYREQDYLYKEELEDMVANKQLDYLIVASSR